MSRIVCPSTRYSLRGLKQGLGSAHLRSLSLSDKGCVLYLPLNSLPNGISPDLSGKGNNGVNHGAALVDIGESYPVFWKNKLINIGGKALSFDGVDDYVQIPNTEDINLGIHDKRTIIVWFKVNDKTISTRKQVVYEEGGSSRGLNIYVFDGLLYFGGWDSPSTESDWAGTYLSTDAIKSGKWHCAALVLDGTPTLQPDTFKGYLDGELIGSGDGSQLWDHSGGIGVGAMYNDTRFHDGNVSGNGHWFSGLIDEVRIYNRALSPVEIKAHFDLTRILFGV